VDITVSQHDRQHQGCEELPPCRHQVFAGDKVPDASGNPFIAFFHTFCSENILNPKLFPINFRYLKICMIQEVI